MKYYHEIFKFKDGNGIMHERVHGYNGTNMPPFNKSIYGFAYDINDDTKKNRLICKPILGEILSYEDNRLKNIYSKRYFSDGAFVPYKKDSKSFRKSGIVDIDSRWYADTYEEAVEMYNELVQKRIDKLQEMIEEAKGDLINDK